MVQTNELSETGPRQVLSLYFPEFCFGDRALGSVSHRNHVSNLTMLAIPTNTSDCYVSMFRFPVQYREHWEATGSVRGFGEIPCFSDFIWIDIDNSDLGVALMHARQIIINLELICPEASRHLDIFFSGGKGFHIGTPTQLFGLEPAVDLPPQMKRIALAIAKDVPIDTSIYEHNRLWRVPNTRHRKSGLYKTQLTVEELANCSIEQIREHAKVPHGEPRPLLTFVGQYEPIPALVEFAQSVMQATGTEGTKERGSSTNGAGWIADALANLVEGNRNATFARIAGRLNRGGLVSQEIEALLGPHADCCQFPRTELTREIEGICTRYPVTTRFPDSNTYIDEKSEIGSGGLTVVSVAELLASGDNAIEW